MSSSFQQARIQPPTSWRMPIVPEDYNRDPLTEEERWALEQYSIITSSNGGTRDAITERQLLARLDQPITDVFHLRHRGRSKSDCGYALRIMRRAMHRYGKIFWEWSPQDWMQMLCPTPAQFYATHAKRPCAHMALMDAAYLLGGVSDLRAVDMRHRIVEFANLYFGTDILTHRCQQLLDALQGKGFSDGSNSIASLRQFLSMLFILKRSPFLEDISEELLISVCSGHKEMQHTRRRIVIALQELNILPPPAREELIVSTPFDGREMAREWYAWCLSWHERVVDLTPRQRRNYVGHLLATGRWLDQHLPAIRTPEQWTEDIALHFRGGLCTWTRGQYASSKGQHLLNSKGNLGDSMKPQAIACYLTALRRFFTDLSKRPHAVDGAPARRIKLDFDPKEALAAPAHIRKALDVASPRDIDLQVWAKLTIAAATLSQSDLPQGTRNPLSFYRAVGLIWVTTARRPNEIARLQLDCVRADWDVGMLDEDGQPVERLPAVSSNGQAGRSDAGSNNTKIHYLQIPAGKNRGAFWIWVPDYVVDAIEIWKQERPSNQRKILDRKDRESVDYLFCYQDTRVGYAFINESLIPVLCARAGVESEDAKGRITGHRGRSTRLTLLRSRGVGLDDLAEYAGHANNRTIRRYARQQPFQLHRIIRDADDVSRIIEGVIDMQAAAHGLPALRWFIGYDADGEPQYCANQIYHTCPHRLECSKCSMFVGGEKAKLLHEGEQTLPITSKVPMTPLEKCVVDGDQAGAEACRALLQQTPAPETPDITLIFNPEGLSNSELEKLAHLATSDALTKLRQALEAHEKRLGSAQQLKSGRNALVAAQRKRIKLIQELIAACEQGMIGQKNPRFPFGNERG
jgi:integrase